MLCTVDAVAVLRALLLLGDMEETRIIRLAHMTNRLGDGGLPQYKLQAFACTSSLEMALRGIRNEEKPSWLWVDARSINQGDYDERSYQVSMMTEIYSHASLVSI
jgi:Heterokaryon incompatibility protein (HET)